VFKIPEHSTINYLLETEKKFFEILLSIYRSEIKENESCMGAFIVFDEYLDKDMTAVKDTFFRKLKELCTHPNIDIQVLIVTHSKSVCHYCDSVIVLQQGTFYRQGLPEKIIKNLPSEFVLLS
jgi:Fe-S cluster assembly ATPase SufC